MPSVSDLLFDFRAFGSGFDGFIFMWTAIVDDDDRFLSGMLEVKMALKVLSHVLFWWNPTNIPIALYRYGRTRCLNIFSTQKRICIS